MACGILAIATGSGRSFPDCRTKKNKPYKSPNEKCRPVGVAHGFGPFVLIRKIPPGQFCIFDHIITLLIQIVYCFMSVLLQALPLNAASRGTIRSDGQITRVRSESAYPGKRSPYGLTYKN